MGLRSTLATFGMSTARSVGNALGCELVVDVSQHSLHTSMQLPDKESRAWDPDLYSKGQLYIKGYANPIKPVSNSDPRLSVKDTVEMVDGDSDDAEADSDADETSTKTLIASPRYQKYMQQNLISELLNPRAEWLKLVYIGIGMLVLQMVTLVSILWGTGVIG